MLKKLLVTGIMTLPLVAWAVGPHENFLNDNYYETIAQNCFVRGGSNVGDRIVLPRAADAERQYNIIKLERDEARNGLESFTFDFEKTPLCEHDLLEAFAGLQNATVTATKQSLKTRKVWRLLDKVTQCARASLAYESKDGGRLFGNREAIERANEALKHLDTYRKEAFNVQGALWNYALNLRSLFQRFVPYYVESTNLYEDLQDLKEYSLAHSEMRAEDFDAIPTYNVSSVFTEMVKKTVTSRHVKSLGRGLKIFAEKAFGWHEDIFSAFNDHQTAGDQLKKDLIPKWLEWVEGSALPPALNTAIENFAFAATPSDKAAKNSLLSHNMLTSPHVTEAFDGLSRYNPLLIRPEGAVSDDVAAAGVASAEPSDENIRIVMNATMRLYNQGQLVNVNLQSDAYEAQLTTSGNLTLIKAQIVKEIYDYKNSEGRLMTEAERRAFVEANYADDLIKEAFRQGL